MTDSAGKILDALYKLLIIGHRDDIEEIRVKVLLFKVGGKTMKVVLGIKAQAN